jgi:tRNA threonylcarbamoyladenosine biosynthesis protein TsaE
LSILETRRLTWPNEAACAATAAALAQRASLREACIELHGPLAAGKTTFVRHLLHALGVQGRVKSPSYAVMEPYELPGGARGLGRALAIWHFDFYRFDDPQEWEDAGFRDVFAATGLKLVEWPEKAAELLPLPDLRIRIDLREEVAAEAGRDVRFDAYTPRGLALLPTPLP